MDKEELLKNLERARDKKERALRYVKTKKRYRNFFDSKQKESTGETDLLEKELVSLKLVIKLVEKTAQKDLGKFQGEIE